MKRARPKAKAKKCASRAVKGKQRSLSAPGRSTRGRVGGRSRTPGRGGRTHTPVWPTGRAMKTSMKKASPLADDDDNEDDDTEDNDSQTEHEDSEEEEDEDNDSSSSMSKRPAGQGLQVTSDAGTLEFGRMAGQADHKSDKKSSTMEDKINLSLTGRVVVKTGCSTGLHSHTEKEVVFLGLNFSDETDCIVKSDDPSKPWCYHSSRDRMLQLAEELRKHGFLEPFGMDGPAVKLVIPGISVPLTSNSMGNMGDQTQDEGGSTLTLYSKAPELESSSPYAPPDLYRAQKLDGSKVTFSLLDPKAGLRILTGFEGDDMKTGVAYYMGGTLDDAATAQANELKAAVGLEADITKRLHVTIAGFAPAWQKVHPKSLTFCNATPKEKQAMQLEEDFQVFRKGSHKGFIGFNGEAATSWTDYAARAAAMADEHARIALEMAAIAQNESSNGVNERSNRLRSHLVDLREQLGLPCTVGHGTDDSVTPEMLKPTMPDKAAQDKIMDEMTLRAPAGFVKARKRKQSPVDHPMVSPKRLQ